MKNFSKKCGFTIIELLVVVAIIGILSAIIMTSLSGSKAKARDAKRISDLGQVQLALELYFDRCRMYPDELETDWEAPSGVCAVNGITLYDYISKIPNAPVGSVYEYSVRSDAQDFVLRTKLESYNEVLKDSLQFFPVPPENLSYSPTFSCLPTPQYREYCIGPK